MSGSASIPPSGSSSDDGVSGPDEGQEVDGRAARAERRRIERRHAILAAAKTVFRDKGYHQASVHDIIDEAQIARGTFYLYFASKQELFSQLVDDFLQVIHRQVRRISLGPQDVPPLLQLRANFRRVVATVLAHEDVASIILRDPTSFDDESRAGVASFFEQVLTMIEDAVRVGRSIGLVGQDAEVHIVAVVALGGVREALARMLGAHLGDESTRAREKAFSQPEQVADQFLRFFLGGLAGPPGDLSLGDPP